MANEEKQIKIEIVSSTLTDGTVVTGSSITLEKCTIVEDITPIMKTSETSEGVPKNQNVKEKLLLEVTCWFSDDATISENTLTEYAALYSTYYSDRTQPYFKITLDYTPAFKTSNVFLMVFTGAMKPATYKNNFRTLNAKGLTFKLLELPFYEVF